MKMHSRGFTLIEIAIVLVIIGLLLGGVLKGQELITGARVRNLISQQDGVKAAYFGFQDRYRALPGDYASAGTNINGVSIAGDGNGRVEGSNGAGTYETLLAWNHLTAAGFLNGSYTLATSTTSTPVDTNNPKNPYSVYIQLIYDNNYGVTAGKPAKHNLKTGSQVPVEIMAEVDRKIDDGLPDAGGFQFSVYVPAGGTAPTIATCTNAGPPVTWAINQGNTDCGGVSLF